MKKILQTLLAVVLSITAQAQTPQGIPYQAAARNANGNILANQAINVRFTIHDSTANGTSVYQETHSTTTNAQGMFSLNMGLGTPTTGSFNQINWGNNAKFMQVELSTNGGTNYTDMGTQQMMSVPYAMYAKSAGGGNSIHGHTFYNNTGTWNSWVVPSGVTKVQISIRGASGGNGGSANGVSGGIGGVGFPLTFTLELKSGDTIKIFLGNNGLNGVSNWNSSGTSGTGGSSTYLSINYNNFLTIFGGTAGGGAFYGGSYVLGGSSGSEGYVDYANIFDNGILDFNKSNPFNLNSAEAIIRY